MMDTSSCELYWFMFRKTTQAPFFVNLCNCILVFRVVDCWLSQFFVDADFSCKSDCWCWQIGLKSCNQHFGGPLYVPPPRILSKPRLSQQLCSTESEVGLHSYRDPPPPTTGTLYVVVVVNCPASRDLLLLLLTAQLAGGPGCTTIQSQTSSATLYYDRLDKCSTHNMTS